MQRTSRPQGRPQATTLAEIERCAFALFTTRGFDETTVDDIAAEVGISRRTLFSYYRSKNDIPWGQFDHTLAGFRAIFAAMPPDLPLWQQIHRAVLQFNTFPENADPPHRDRMRLILSTPTLQAHSVLRYSDWRQVIIDHVAAVTGRGPQDLLPRLVSQISLAMALTAYEEWLSQDTVPLLAILDRTMTELRHYLSDAPIGN